MLLTEEDHKDVLNLIYDIVNTSDPESEYENPLCYINLFNKIDLLILKYGEIPDLLSIKADYTDSVEERLDLYIKVIDLAQKLDDPANITQSAESITSIYIDELPNYSKAFEWFQKLENYVLSHGDKYIIQSLTETKKQIMRLKIDTVL